MAEIRLSPFHRGDMTLAGLVVGGRWPHEMREWVHVMLLLTRLATTPGLLPMSEVFRAIEQLPDDPEPDTVGLILDEGPAVSTCDEISGIDLAAPPALLVLHPPNACPDSPGFHGTARGVVLLPGVPHLGLSHQAAWVEVEPDGTVARIATGLIDEPGVDVDVAVLANLLVT
jgi:hypothetical protein